MDRRTLLFFISLTLTLFLVNIFFTYQEQETNRVWYEQQKIKKAQQQTELRSNIQRRTKNPTDLPLVDLFAKPNGQDYLASGVKVGNNILTISWDTHLPDTVYTNASTKDGQGEAVKLHGTSTQAGQPVVFAIAGAEPLKVVELPSLGTFELQLVSFTPDTESPNINISLGEFRDSALFIPAEDLDLPHDQLDKFLPHNNAIALKSTAQGYLPVGIYSTEDHALIFLSSFPTLAPLANVTEKSAAEVPTAEQQKYYVLESPYQQLVFSNIGGALVEINLPFESDTNHQSVVREIEVDREMVADHPHDAHFPSQTYFTSTESGKGPYLQHQSGALGGYYPLLRRNLIGNHGGIKAPVAPQYYAFNIVSEYPEVAQRPYEVTYFDSRKIVFESTVGRRKITRTYSINPDLAPYCLELTIDVEGDARGLWITSGIPEVEMISGSPAPAIKYRVTRNGKSEVVNIDPPNDMLTFTSLNPDWLSDGNGFFGIILDPLTEIDSGYKVQKVSGKAAPSRLVLLDVGQDNGKDVDFPGYNVMLPLKSAGGQMKFRLYAGPYTGAILDKVDAAYSDPATGYNPDYAASQSFHGWFSFISQPFADFLFILMKFFHTLTDSWAMSIVLLTVALRLMLYPLNAWSMKSTLKMQELAPEIQAINDRNKKDPKKGQMEIMNLYRERGVNPLSGCFPMLIQLPFLIAMFDLLRSTFELRGASFIPGWIDNLTSPDVVFSWTSPTIPFIGNQFHLLPIILGLCMFLQQRMMSPAPADPSQMTDQQRQTRAMSTLMAPVFTVLFYNFPSGLNIYWLSSTLLGMLQQIIMTRQFKGKKAAAPVPVKAISTKATPAKKKGKGKN